MKKYKKNISLKELNKKENGITLIALVITIIVLLILAGVTIATLTGENGILSKASNAKDKNEIVSYEEKIKLEALDEQAERKYKQKEEVFIESLENRIKQKDWTRDTYICDANFIKQEEMEKNNLLIVNIKDGYQIIIDVDNDKLSIAIRDTAIVKGNLAIIEYDGNGGTGIVESQKISIGNIYSVADNSYKRDNHVFLGWCEDKEGKGKMLLPNEKIIVNKEKMTLYAIWLNQNLTESSIIQGVEKLNQSGYYQINANNITYKIHLYCYNESQKWTENMTFGDANDVGTDSADASRMVVVKVIGDLDIASGVTVKPYNSNNGGPKGFLLYCTGNIELRRTNNK